MILLSIKTVQKGSFRTYPAGKINPKGRALGGRFNHPLTGLTGKGVKLSESDHPKQIIQSGTISGQLNHFIV
jgi:hypothetical protein